MARVTHLILAIGCLFFSTASASSKVAIREGRDGKVAEISGLAEAFDCHPFEFEGKVVKREFADDGLSLTGIVLETQDGARSFYNVEIPKDLNMALLGNVTVGLQRLARMGRVTSGRAYACGAAGRVQNLDIIR